MNIRFAKSLQFSVILFDFFTLNILYFLIEAIFQEKMLISTQIEYTHFIFVLNFLWLGTSAITNIYNERVIVSFESFTKVSLRAYVYFFLMVVLYLFFFRMLILSRVFIGVVMVSIPLAILFNRVIYLFIYQYFRKANDGTSKVLVIGYNTLSKKLVDYLSEEVMNKEVVGYCEDVENVEELSRYPILSNITGAMDACKKYGATEIYSTIAPEQNSSVYHLLQTADQNCIRFKIVPDLSYFFNKQMHIDYLNEIPVISMRKEPLDDIGNQAKKRVFDVIVSSLVVILVLSWLIPLIGLIIKLESKGPVFFAQWRTGKNNKKFLCLEFRSMWVNGKANLLQASKNDSRITRFGKFLRKTSLDEFPQFINVLRGDMSLIGPRPHMLKHTDQYSKLIGKYMVRQLLKPGITGWAQVNGFRGETQNVLQMQGRVDHDLWYLENWSLYFDLKIIILTFLKLFKGDRNAY